MPNELKPCPFCGEKPCLDRHEIFCDCCGAKMPIPIYGGEGFPTYQEARQEMIENWEMRADNG
jgi:Lar family restriction alleviation protein